ncbi:MAG: GNAT family N-acetyltransferase [Acidobacteria bacterium]|nr:MAG: GNAT family N-acetyltransferase [Acidobacteriota bacterium]
MQLSLTSGYATPLATSRQAEGVKIYERFSDLPKSYDALFAACAGKSFFHSLPWFQNLCDTALDPGDKIRIYALETQQATEVLSAALVTRWRPASALGFFPRTLSSLSNFYTSLYGPLLLPGNGSAATLQKVACFIRADSPAWDAVDLKWLDRQSPVFVELEQALRSAGMLVQTYFCAGNWYLPVRGRSYRQYFDDLRSSVRNIAKSKNRKIERSGRARVDIVTGAAHIESAIEAYQRVYASSWKVPEPYPQFIPGLIRTCAREGWLRLGIAHIDGEPAAAQIWIVCNGTASIYKIAYDKRFIDLSVGSYLTTHMMEYALDVDKVNEVDYLTGDDKYKQDWMSNRRERWGILAMNPRTVRGGLAIARHIGGRMAKRAFQSWIKKPPKSPMAARIS